MAQELQKDLMEIRHEVMVLFSHANPSKEFGATITMAVVGLHMLEARIKKTNSIEERRRLINEFNREKYAIGKGLRAFKKSSGTEMGNSKDKIKRALS